MSNPPFPSSISITAQDFTLLNKAFNVLAQNFLPLPVQIQFWSQDCHRQTTYGNLSDQQAELLGGNLPAMCREAKLAFQDSLLVLPLINNETLLAACVINTDNNDLFQKISNDWLHDFQKYFRSHALIKKNTQTDYATGLYNGFCFQETCEHLIDRRDTFSIMLIGLHDKSSGSDVFNLRSTIRNAHFLESLVPSPIYHLGNGIFALLYEDTSNQSVLQNGHRLLTRLKRQSCTKVHIGTHTVTISKDNHTRHDQSDVDWHQYLTPCWQSLEEAGRRGPFALCDSKSIQNAKDNPFCLPSKTTLKHLRQKWKGIQRFTLALFRYDKQYTAPPLSDLIVHYDDKEITVCLESPGEVYVLLCNIAPETALEWINDLRSSLKSSLLPKTISVGISSFPILKTSKTATIRNCKKALRHGEFIGPGSLTVFDSVSLNISGDYYFDEGNLKQAASEFRLGLQIDPDDLNLMNSLGVTYAEMNRHRESAEIFEKVTSKEIDNFMSLLNLGHSYRMLGHTVKAVTAYENALGKYTSSTEINISFHYQDLLLQLSRLYNDQERYEESLHLIQSYQKLKHNIDEFIIFRILGEALMETGQDKNAMRALQQALRIYPHDGDSLSMLGELYMRTLQEDEIALSFCKQATEIDEDNWRYRQRLGQVLLGLNRIDEAQQEARKSLQLKKSNFPATLLMGEIYKKQNQLYKARNMFQRIIRGTQKKSQLHIKAKNHLSY